MSVDAFETVGNQTLSELVSEAVAEARRQLEICNACRYCEGYCSVFPAMTFNRAFSDGDVTQLANLCHNCRGCYYACQYTAPHEFDLNLPRVLAEVRVESWERFAWPNGLAKLFQKNGIALAGALFAMIAFLLGISQVLRPENGEGFYAVISHTVMATLFAAAAFTPIVIVAMGLARYWRHVGGEWLTIKDIHDAFNDAAKLKNLSGGAAGGCNYEKEDRFTMARRWAHHGVMWGFLLCFGSTVSGTILHYVFSMEAPYGPLSLPKLLGVPGGVLMTLGGVSLIYLKMRADKTLGAPKAWAGEMAFILLLTGTAATGLGLYWAASAAWVRPLLTVHLGTVMTLFLLLPYTKMAHIPFRLAALVRDAQIRRNKSVLVAEAQ